MSFRAGIVIYIGADLPLGVGADLPLGDRLWALQVSALFRRPYAAGAAPPLVILTESMWRRRPSPAMFMRHASVDGQSIQCGHSLRALIGSGVHAQSSADPLKGWWSTPGRCARGCSDGR